MTARRSNRWALSFADLSLLLLGFMAIIHIPPNHQDSSVRTDHVKASKNERFEIPVEQLFASGEAMLKPDGLTLLKNTAGRWNNHKLQVKISITGLPESSARLEDWELSAARLASVGRALDDYAEPLQSISLGEINVQEGSRSQSIEFVVRRPT